MSVGLAYAIANAIFGGSAEYVALLFKDSGVESNFYWYVTLMCAIALIAAIIMPNPKLKGYLQGSGTEI
jgi:FtsH-binding integral membrane protein